MNIATRTDTALPGRDGAGREQQAGRPRRSWTLFQRMSGQYWRMARRRRVLSFISQMFRDDLTIYPLQYEETVIHLTALRRAAQKAQEFYRGLDPQSMKQV